MTGLGLLGLILISMGWLFFLAGLAINYRSKQAIPLVVGVVGSLTAFFSVPALMKHGIGVPWPWFWILLPLVVDPGCLPGLLRWWGNRMRGSR
jgi:hypothetical protein